MLPDAHALIFYLYVRTAGPSTSADTTTGVRHYTYTYTNIEVLRIAVPMLAVVLTGVYDGR